MPPPAFMERLWLMCHQDMPVLASHGFQARPGQHCCFYPQEEVRIRSHDWARAFWE